MSRGRYDYAPGSKDGRYGRGQQVSREEFARNHARIFGEQLELDLGDREEAQDDSTDEREPLRSDEAL